jgi:hypothetical protein
MAEGRTRFRLISPESIMNRYRLYRLSPVGEIVGPPMDIDYANDLAALADAKEMSAAENCRMEVWHGRRLVSQPMLPILPR